MKKLGARVSVVTLTAQIALGSLALGLVPTIAMAAMTVPTSGSTFASIGFTDSDDVWSTPGNASASDNARATTTISNASDISDYLRATGFGFSIPLTATINGIELRIERVRTDDGQIRDNIVQLAKDNIVTGSNKAAGTTNWPTSEATVTYGASNDLWGTAWTPADINDADFGAVLSVKKTSGGNSTANVDHITITVHYTEAPVNGTLHITKSAIGGNGTFDFTSPSSFSMTTVGGTDTEDLSLAPGTYTVTETVPSGWTQTANTCVDVVVASGNTTNCTITNTKSASVTITKQTIPDLSVGTFNFSGSLGDDAALSDGESEEFSVVPGEYLYGETVPAGWALTDINCGDAEGEGGDAIVSLDVGGVAFDLEAGDDVHCTFTNTKLGTIVVQKETDPDGSLETFTFSGAVTGSVADGETLTDTSVLPGSYSVEEIADEHWELQSIVCSENATENSVGDVPNSKAMLSVEAGETVTCVFTNEQVLFPVCHFPPGNPDSSHTEWVEEDEIAGHIHNHEDDYEGVCDEEDENGGDEEDEECDEEDEVLICHAPPGNPENKSTHSVCPSEVSGHIGHGDTMGSCDESSAVCGNDMIEEGEQCDDGNTEDGDGCSATCQEQPLACETMDDGLVAHWKFDEGEGSTATDSTVHDNQGTLVGDAAFAANVPGTLFYNPASMQFDGSNDLIDVPDTTDLGFDSDDAFSVSAWVNGTSFSGDFRTIVHKIDDTTSDRNGYLFTVTSGGVPQVYLINDFDVGNDIIATSTLPLSTETWYQVTFTYDGSSSADGVHIYVNGSDVTGSPLADGLSGSIQSAQEFEIGSRGDAGIQSFNGFIDDVRVYDRALMPSEVLELAGGQCDVEEPTGPVCGNGIVEEEQCDDGNLDNGDGCSEICEIEEGYSCTVEEEESVCTMDLAMCEPSEDMLAYLRLDESEGTLSADSTGNGHNGTWMNAPVFTPAGTPMATFDNPGALSFSGTSFVTLGDTLDMGTADETVSLWFKTNDGDSDFSLFSKSFYGGQPSRYFLVDEGTGLYAAFHGTSVAETTPRITGLNDNQWHHAVAVYDRDGLLTLFVDGNFGGSVDISSQAAHDMQSAYPFFLGRYNDAVDGLNPHPSTLALNGVLDDVRVYDRALSSDEIADLYAGQCTFDVEEPEEVDTDFDGVPDEDDNCPLTMNPGQENTFGGPAGDACEEEDDGGDDEEVQTLGFSTPDVNGNQGARRGKQTNILKSLIHLFGGNGNNGNVSPGAFGGPGNEEFTEEEAEVICRMRKALPADVSNAVRNWVALQLSEVMPHSVEAIADELKTGSICPEPVAARVISVKPVTFHVDVNGYPVSSNETWNKCIRGTATLEDIRNNPDRDEDGFGYSCSRYHTSNTWKHPDLGVYFTWKKLTKAVTLPAGYALKQDQAVTQR